MEKQAPAHPFTFEQKEKFAHKLAEMREWYVRGQRNWSFLHHLTTTLAITFSAAAALIPQLKSWEQASAKDWTTLLAGVAAVLISLSKGFGFERKWRANRLSNSKIQALDNELTFRDPTMADVTKLNRIVEDHDLAITGK